MRIHNGKVIRSCSLILVLVLCVSLFAGCSNNGTQSSEDVSKAGTLLTTIYEDVLYIADSDGNIHTADFYGEVYTEQTSMDGYKYIAVDDDEYRLLYFNGEEILTLASNVAVAAMSVDGNIVAYITVTDEDNSISELRLYADGEETVIDTGTIVMCAVSPDGSAVGYTTADEDGNYRTYYWNGTDDIHEVGKYRPIIAISNGGEYVYYAQLNDNGWTEGYYVQHEDDSASKVKMADTINEEVVYFNNDGSELLFSDGENTYIFAKGEKRFEVPNGDLFPQFPESLIQCRSDYTGVDVITYSTASFSNHYFLLGVEYDPDFVYMDQDYNAVTILSDCSKDCIHICADGKTAFFRIGEGFYRGGPTLDDHDRYSSYIEEEYGYQMGTYRVHSDQLEKPVLLYNMPWHAISENENIHYYYYVDYSEEVSDRRTSNDIYSYISSSNVFYEVDVSKKNPEPVRLQPEDLVLSYFYDDFYSRVYIMAAHNPESSMIPEDAWIAAVLNGKTVYMSDGVYYCYDGKKTQPVNGLEDWYSNNYGPIRAYENVFIAFASREAHERFVYDHDKSGLLGCYFSIDGINFMPLVENYVAEEN